MAPKRVSENAIVNHGCICCVVGCHNSSYTVPKVSLHSFPNKKKDPDRRKLWIQAVRRNNEDGTPWEPNKYSKVCSNHFVTGAPIYHPQCPDYVPTVFPEHYKKRIPSINSHKRFQRAQQRGERRLLRQVENVPLPELADVTCAEDVAFAEDVTNDTMEEDEIALPKCNHIACQADLVNKEQEKAGQVFTFTCEHFGLDCNTFVESPKPQQVPSKTSTAAGPEHRSVWFSGYKSVSIIRDQGNDNHCVDLCGVSLNVLALIISLFRERNSQKHELKITDKVVLFLMKMKLGITFCSLGVLFSINRTTAARVFYFVLKSLCQMTSSWISWLPKHVIQKRMPTAFRIHYPDCRVIIDCFELRTEVMSNIEIQNYMFSHYKNCHTAKYLICIAPHGYIMYISKGYGGRSTDADITLESGVISRLQPGDQVMADRGFPRIKVDCQQAGAVFVMPPFSNPNEAQFSPAEMVETYNIASVRIHVERMIERVKIYDVLNKRIPVELFPYLDDIVRTACVLANLQNPIIAAD